VMDDNHDQQSEPQLTSNIIHMTDARSFSMK
jgi:hypothetical protein